MFARRKGAKLNTQMRMPVRILSVDFVHPYMGVGVLCTVDGFLKIRAAAG
jgi:hypothetical protein